MPEPTGPAEVLRAKEAELLAQLEEITRPPQEMGAISFGKRIGDGTPIAVERMTAVTVHDKLTATLAEVRRALERIDEGTYGVCEECGEPIGEGRLEVRPWATRCLRHS